jgi:hypothetical protein
MRRREGRHTTGRVALLGIAVGLIGSAATAAPSTPSVPVPACPPTPTAWLERALRADCLDCWQAAPSGDPAVTNPRTLVLDWILPTADDAPLAIAALPEAAERFPAAVPAVAVPPVATPPAGPQRLPAPPAGVRLEVGSGLAWNGYVGVSFDLTLARRSALPVNAVGYLALVERIPAGSDGSGQARQLVRSVAGPLSLQPPASGRRVQHLVGMRLPPNGDVARLGAVGWVETVAHRVLLASASPPAGCRKPVQRGRRDTPR